LLLTLRSIGDQVGRVFERHRTEVRLQAQADHQKMLAAELNHRVKNMLAVVTGIASQTLRNSNSLDDFYQSFMDRLRALNKAHSLLASNTWKSTGLKELLDELTSPYNEVKPQITLNGPAVELTPQSALAMSLVFHELLTNSAKYGALSRQGGTLSVDWTIEHGLSTTVVLRWIESGLNGLSSPVRSGFGTRLIQSTITHQLHGEITTEYRNEGLRCTMAWPINSARLGSGNQ
jgi:two-component system CheB/CheR fusion protein